MADVLVLCYHALSVSWASELAVRPERFAAQIESLLARGYRGARFTEAVTQSPARRTLAVTFDDAYRSVHELAFVILERLGVPATVFVPTAFAGNGRPMAWPGIDEWPGTPHEGELSCMSWEDLRHLAEAGWEVGSHTRSHPRLTGLDDAALARELGGSRRDVEDALRRRCESIAYPYGDLDARVAAAAATAGYRAGGALPPRPHAGSALAWPRVGVYPVDAPWRFRLKTSPVVRRLRTLR